MTNIARTQCPILLMAALSLVAQASAGSATWKASPSSGDWNTAANWTPQTVPNSSSDTATFATSNTTSVSLSNSTLVDGIVFEAGASAFQINIEAHTLELLGTGITNNSGFAQNFLLPPELPQIWFRNNSVAGKDTVFTLPPNATVATTTGFILFLDSSSADHGTFILPGPVSQEGNGAVIEFEGASTAAEGQFTVYGSASSGAFGAFVEFRDTSNAGRALFNIYGGTGNPGGVFFDGGTAAEATLIANGGPSGGLGGSISFGASAGDATLIANGGPSPGSGGTIVFSFASIGERARVEVFGNGKLDIRHHDRVTVGIGSIEGDGIIMLGAHNLAVGRNNLTTTFSGRIRDNSGLKRGHSGSLTKVGNGKLTLERSSTYAGGTTVEDGTLVVKNARGSGTGPGPVQVNHGRLAGSGIIAGAVTIGSGNGTVGRLGPATDPDSPLTIQSQLTFKSDGIYAFGLDSSKGTADKIIADGVTIVSGAQFHFSDSGNSKLTRGRVLTAISNTSASAIAGTFANLSDGLTFTQGANTYRVNYEGGGGNDLTLTVQ